MTLDIYYRLVILVLSFLLLGYEYANAPDVLKFPSKEALYLMGLSSISFCAVGLLFNARKQHAN